MRGRYHAGSERRAFCPCRFSPSMVAMRKWRAVHRICEESRCMSGLRPTMEPRVHSGRSLSTIGPGAAGACASNPSSKRCGEYNALVLCGYRAYRRKRGKFRMRRRARCFSPENARSWYARPAREGGHGRRAHRRKSFHREYGRYGGRTRRYQVRESPARWCCPWNAGRRTGP